MLRMFLLLALCFPALAQAEEVVLGLSQKRVQITTNFDGSEILIFGAVKRDGPAPSGAPLEVIVAVEGPSTALTVRRKERRYGIWINVDAVEVDAAPAFYAVATSVPFADAITKTEDLRYSVSIPRAVRSVGAPMNVKDAQGFASAVIRIRENSGLYQLHENSVTLTDQTLFETRVALPANLTEGDYKARIFLTRSGKVVSEYETLIDVHKVGLERFLFNLSRQQPLIYGLLSLAIAIAAGWLASAAFRIFQRN
ncbi:TIGR02186 family protein [Lentibacter algarum]|uniref:TIGR02186 family protein n=1 Tax=Lentibacter algarum TaxID=576131 RepID=UPI001C08C181|nr:TIGR02186 family protein [Lentibacter algarum]MBU2983520.1 TIGR02186 family protein [Lentibacter algarum]